MVLRLWKPPIAPWFSKSPSHLSARFLSCSCILRYVKEAVHRTPEWAANQFHMIINELIFFDWKKQGDRFTVIGVATQSRQSWSDYHCLDSCGQWVSSLNEELPRRFLHNFANTALTDSFGRSERLNLIWCFGFLGSCISWVRGFGKPGLGKQNSSFFVWLELV